jgi:hypothetical protein
MMNAPTADLPEKTDLHVRTIVICPLDDEMTTDREALVVTVVASVVTEAALAVTVNRVALAAQPLHRDHVNSAIGQKADGAVVDLAEDGEVEEEVKVEVVVEDLENVNLTDTLEIAGLESSQLRSARVVAHTTGEP